MKFHRKFESGYPIGKTHGGGGEDPSPDSSIGFLSAGFFGMQKGRHPELTSFDFILRPRRGEIFIRTKMIHSFQSRGLKRLLICVGMSDRGH